MSHFSIKAQEIADKMEELGQYNVPELVPEIEQALLDAYDQGRKEKG